VHGEFDNCEFSENGRAAVSYGMYAPALGIDIEPSFITLERPGDLTFHNCKCQNNGLGAISVTAQDCRFYGCLFWGTDYYSIFSQQANHLFENCEIYGACLNVYDPTVLKDPTEPPSPTNTPFPQFSPKYISCHFEDKESPGYGVYRVNTPFACVSSNRANVILSNCTVIGNETRGVQFGTPSDTSKPHALEQCTITHKMASLMTPKEDPAHGHQSQIYCATLDMS